LRARATLGEDEFVDRLNDYLRKHKDVPEIPKSQRYMNRPVVGRLLSENIFQILKARDRKITEAVGEYDVTQREVADHPGLNFSSVS
jgi:putative transposase